jgi:hypothetical protein
MQNLPYALKELYPDELIGWDWSGENLKLIAQPDTDLEEFACVIRDQINEVVLFEKGMTVYLGKEGSPEKRAIRINS